MRTAFIRIAVAMVLVTAVAAPAAAQGTFTFNLGYFALRSADARSSDDVLVADLGLDGLNSLPLFFEVKDFNAASFSGDYYVPIGSFIEAGVGLGYYQRTVTSVYETVTFPGGGDIFQDLKLRVVPFSAAVRVLPLGRDGIVQPYFGGGVGVFKWRYSEIGDFVDTFDGTIFSARYIGDGVATGPVAFGGVRFPVGDHFMTGGEARWQQAEGTLPSDVDFLAPKIDLGGWTFSWTLSFK